ncbi:hypothetical protein [Sinomonas terrae]|uniref:Lipoprotein n=1 Tax=Sinomonas terrae TaxID=2908838 RepID=A0ABS9TWI5_9MICC|nr:hypothetical protein [Sinomonas terrae]MCH6468632.1 hypothetical protein [Sinomonas terrae]
MKSKQSAVLGVVCAGALALAGCTGGGGTTPTPTSSSSSSAASTHVYSESELRNLISGLKDSDGNALNLYSGAQVTAGKDLGNLLLSTATVDPSDCKSIATAGLVNSVDNGSVAVAISDSQKPRTVSAQSGSQGPDAEQLVRDIRGKMTQCSTFTVSAVGQKVTVSSKQLQAKTNADETFGTVSTKGGNSSDMLMQVSGGQGRLLVVATKSGGNLGDTDQQELEDLVNNVLQKASSSGTSGTASPSESPSETSSGSGSGGQTSAPTVTETVTATPTDGTQGSGGATPTSTTGH